MRLTSATDIALRTLIYLGQKNADATIQEVAEAFDISKSHLMKVVMMLVAANLLESERGRNGGIRLALKPGNISIGHVVRLMENSLALVVCMEEGASVTDCPLLPQCRLKQTFQRAQEAFFNSLDQSSLADIL